MLGAVGVGREGGGGEADACAGAVAGGSIGGRLRVDIDELNLAAATPDDKILLMDEALERLEAEDAEKARIVVLKFFGGLTNQDVARILGVTERTIERQWAFAKAWLFQNIRNQG